MNLKVYRGKELFGVCDAEELSIETAIKAVHIYEKGPIFCAWHDKQKFMPAVVYVETVRGYYRVEMEGN